MLQGIMAPALLFHTAASQYMDMMKKRTKQCVIYHVDWLYAYQYPK